MAKDAAAFADAEPIRDAEPLDAEPGRDAEPLDADPIDAEPIDAMEPDAGTLELTHWANTQWPPWMTLAPGGRGTVYGQIWIEGVTDQPGAAAGIEAELGFGPVGSDPSQWSWVAATYNVDAGNNDEYQADLIAPASGAYDYAFRFRFNGSPWIYADRSDGGRQGTDDGFASENAGKLAVREPNTVLRIATLNLHCINDDPLARIDAAAARFAALGTDLIALQEVCEGAPVTNAAEYLAQQLSAAAGRPYQRLYAMTHLANGMTPEGLGIVSALPLAEVQIHDLPIADFPRKTIIAVAATPIGMVAFATAHLSYRAQDGQARLDQANEIVSHVDQLPPIAAAIVAGDFNSTPDEPPPQALISASFADSFALLHPADDGFTYSSSNPARRIDYLFARADAAWPHEITAAEVEFGQPYAPGSYVSDHRGVSGAITAR